jgi:hypothetical protein
MCPPLPSLSLHVLVIPPAVRGHCGAGGSASGFVAEATRSSTTASLTRRGVLDHPLRADDRIVDRRALLLAGFVGIDDALRLLVHGVGHRGDGRRLNGLRAARHRLGAGLGIRREPLVGRLGHCLLHPLPLLRLDHHAPLQDGGQHHRDSQLLQLIDALLRTQVTPALYRDCTKGPGTAHQVIRPTEPRRALPTGRARSGVARCARG